MNILDVKNLKKSFGTLEVLKGISFSLKKGEVLCLIGASGSGKSTVLRCLNYLETPDSGEIYFKGKKTSKDQPLSLLRAQMGMVFQHFNLFPHMTVLQNLTVAPLSLSHQSKKDIQLQGLELLDKVGLSDKKNEYPNRLSGGQKQRVAIARALNMNPDLLLFDEPTSALDPETVESVLEVMKKLAEEGRTMIIVTHEIEFARAVADRIGFVHNGVILEISSAQKLLDSPKEERTREFLQAVRRG